MFIERATHELAKNHRVRVVSSDGAEQIIILGNGALRVSARAFEREVRAVEARSANFWTSKGILHPSKRDTAGMMVECIERQENNGFYAQPCHTGHSAVGQCARAACRGALLA